MSTLHVQLFYCCIECCQYNLIRPPKYGNCTVTENKFETIIKVSDLKDINKTSKLDASVALQKRKIKWYIKS